MTPRIRELTAPGSGGVSVLRIEGAGALDLVREWGAESSTVGGLRVARLVIEGELLDEVVVCVLGADDVEVHLHGSPPLVKAFLEHGSDLTGELRRASLEELALEAMAKTNSALAARVLLDQGEGVLRRELEALLEVDGPAHFARLAELVEASRRVRRLFAPSRVLLAGPVNAGKSTLFNALVGGERVITGSEAGTTRDLIEERVELAGWPVALRDSAGRREVLGDGGDRDVERAGQGVAREAEAWADLVLWLRPPGGAPAPALETRARVCELPSLSDRPGGDPSGIGTASDPVGAVRRVEEEFAVALDLPADPWKPGRPILFDPDWLPSFESVPGEGAAASRSRIRGLLDHGVPGR